MELKARLEPRESAVPVTEHPTVARESEYPDRTVASYAPAMSAIDRFNAGPGEGVTST